MKLAWILIGTLIISLMNLTAMLRRLKNRTEKLIRNHGKLR
jgi:hypothetical protein